MVMFVARGIQDDWYVLAAKKDAYAVIYYRGSNDAWDGYGGAVVYTREPRFPKQYTKEVDDALQKIGLKFKDFELTDNSCRAAETRVEEIRNDLVFVESKVAGGLVNVEKGALETVTKDVRLLESEMEMIAGAVGREAAAIEKEIVKDVIAVEGAVEKEEQIAANFVGKLFK